MKLTNCPFNRPSKKQKRNDYQKVVRSQTYKKNFCFTCSFPIGLDI